MRVGEWLGGRVGVREEVRVEGYSAVSVRVGLEVGDGGGGGDGGRHEGGEGGG